MVFYMHKTRRGSTVAMLVIFRLIQIKSSVAVVTFMLVEIQGKVAVVIIL